MRPILFTAAALLWIIGAASPALAHSDDETACDIDHAITDAAEAKPGGALYEGGAMASGMTSDGMASDDDDMEAMAVDMKSADMAGAHMAHGARHGGAFFMAPDKIHHVEAVYAGHCGFRVFFYNAFIEPIRADRFQAFMTIFPADEDAIEFMRFLSPAHQFSVLETALGDDLARPFTADLYVKFPESDEPQLFTVHIPATGD